MPDDDTMDAGAVEEDQEYNAAFDEDDDAGTVDGADTGAADAGAKPDKPEEDTDGDKQEADDEDKGSADSEADKDDSDKDGDHTEEEDIDPDADPDAEDKEETGDVDDTDKDKSIKSKAEEIGKSLLKTLKKITGKSEDEEEEDEEEEDAEEDPAPKKPAPKPATQDEDSITLPTDEEVAAVFDNLPDGRLKDDIKEAVEDHPALAKMMLIAVKANKPEGDSKVVDELRETTDRLEEENAKMANQLAKNSLFNELAEMGHTDARKIARSKAFGVWLDDQSEGMKAISKSWDPEHAELIYKAFKEDAAKKTKKTHADKKKEEKKKVDDLHGSTIKGGKGTAPAETKAFTEEKEKTEYEKSFDEDDD